MFTWSGFARCRDRRERSWNRPVGHGFADLELVGRGSHSRAIGGFPKKRLPDPCKFV